MEDDHDEAHHFLHPPAPPPTSMRHRATSDGCGKIVEVQGGHIVRSTTGRKDRHSKVCTVKGPRDRRVRLSAHTAIQFYDVQDRLGVDRPSKAVDWLIKKARTSIDELAQLPPWDPGDAIRNAAANAKPRRTAAKTKISPSSPQQIQFDGVAEHPNQDLRFSLHSFPECPPSLLHHQQQQHHHNSASASVAEPVLFYGQSNPFGCDTSTGGWEQQRLVSGAAGTGNGGGGGSQYFAPLHNPSTTSFQQVLGQSQFISQRGPLQSSYTPMIRAWFDHSIISTDYLNHHHHIPQPVFASGEFCSGFRVPARFQGQEEERHDGLTNKPSSASRH